jgi:hypothetical protein
LPISLEGPDKLVQGIHYSYDKLKKILRIAPEHFPTDFISGDFVFTWTIPSGDKITKKFSLKAVTGLADYDLVVP